MLPPVEASVLAENPDFASLYTTLTTEVLNPDGTTRAETDAKARNSVRAVSHTPACSFSQTPAGLVPVQWMGS